MKSINFKNLLFNLAMALITAIFLAPLTGLDKYAIMGGIVLLGITFSLFTKYGRYNMKGLLFMGLQREIWQDHIEGEIFKDNTFLKYCFKVSAENILGGRVVHIQQSGGSGNVVKNRKNVPASTRRREDSDIVYLLDDYTTDPVLISYTDDKELSPEYRNSVLGEDRNKLVQEVAENTLYNWTNSVAHGNYNATAIPATAFEETSGANGVANNILGNENRKKASRVDLQKMSTKFRRANRWFEGKMVALIPPTMLMEMYPADDIVTATLMQNVTEQERREGVLLKDHGWKIMSRSSVLVCNDGANTIKAPGEVVVSGDDEAALFWYEDAVEFAMGSVVPFFKEKDPNNYGDVFSFLIYAGGRARRSGYEGIGVLKQAKTA